MRLDLGGCEFRQRVEAIVEAFDRMREDLEQERRAAERQWARRAKQIEAVTFIFLLNAYVAEPLAVQELNCSEATPCGMRNW